MSEEIFFHGYYCHSPNRASCTCDVPLECPWMDEYGHCDYRGTNIPEGCE